ncbi:MAG: hypothetical protein IJU73_01385 [Ruminococcus sp.]|nr:hypothetical protein [Ruminococcus sp.]
MKFPNATKGVKKLFTAELLKLISVICLAAAIICAVLLFVSASNNSTAGAGASTIAAMIFLVASSILMIISGIMMLVGLVQAGRDEGAFKSALICILVEVVALIVASIISANSSAGIGGSFDLSVAGSSLSLSHLITSVANLLITVFIITGIIRLADQLNDGSVSAKGSNVLKIIVVVNVLVIIADIIALIFGANPASAVTCGILLIVALVLQIIQFFMYLSLLSNGKKMLADN